MKNKLALVVFFFYLCAVAGLPIAAAAAKKQEGPPGSLPVQQFPIVWHLDKIKDMTETSSWATMPLMLAPGQVTDDAEHIALRGPAYAQKLLYGTPPDSR